MSAANEKTRPFNSCVTLTLPTAQKIGHSNRLPLEDRGEPARTGTVGPDDIDLELVSPHLDR